LSILTEMDILMDTEATCACTVFLGDDTLTGVNRPLPQDFKEAVIQKGKDYGYTIKPVFP